MAGAQVLALNPAIADRLLGDPFAEGVIVGGLAQNSIAARQGFRRGDIIVSVNGQAVDTAQDLAQLTAATRVTDAQFLERLQVTGSADSCNRFPLQLINVGHHGQIPYKAAR